MARRRRKIQGIRVKQVRAADLRPGDIVRWERLSGTTSPWAEVVAASSRRGHKLYVEIRYSTGLVAPVEFQLHQLVEFQESYG